MESTSLVGYLEASARRWPEHTAVVDPYGVTLTYRELHAQATHLACFLRERGVRRGDRVGVVLPKSASAVAALFGIMKAGAAYVPVDVTAPAERGRRILTDCHIRALFVDSRVMGVVPDPADVDLGALVVVGHHTGGERSAGVPVTTFDEALAAGTVAEPAPEPPTLSDLAYILYTSGSTGMPKGVMLSHLNATSFVDWCSDTFAPTEHDRFGNHAPFHFDLSVLDIYVSIKHGATLFLVSEELGKKPRELAKFIEQHRLTVWYSTPSILTLLLEYGHLSEVDVSSLRLVFFAGEVFPIKHLRALKTAWPHPTYYNLYGPTETNVCTFARIPDVIPDGREMPYPIGPACRHCHALVLDDGGQEVATGGEGLLYIRGDSLFSGYWNRPTENTAAFIERDSQRWYNTGDLVRWDPTEGFTYSGRKDRMVKRRGYRIELGEIERALYAHPRVNEAAVLALPDADSGVRIVAVLSATGTSDRPSIIELKAYCARALPTYMSPDRFVFEERLPKTSTDKVDYQTLRLALLDTPVTSLAGGASV